MDAGFQEELSLLLAPIAGEEPCGKDERHNHIYLEADNEAKKLGGIRQDPVDWERVLELSSQLLRSSTKDLKLAACMTLAKYHLAGFAGLDQGFHVLVELLDKYWDHVHPRPRTPTNYRRRASPLTWFNGHLVKLFQANPPKASEANAMASIQKNAERYKKVCVERFGNQSPAFEDLLTTIARAVESMDLGAAPINEAPAITTAPDQPSPESNPAPPPTPEPPTSPPQTASESTPQGLESDQSIQREIETLLTPISDAKPSGENERYNEKFEQAGAEAKKIDDQLSDKKPDWDLALNLSTELLQTLTKDLTLAAYFTLARYELDGIRGLSTGYHLTTELLERFWSSIHPQPRNATNFKRRASPLSWLNKHVEKRLQAYEVRVTDGPDIADLAKIVLRYAEVCNTRFENAAPATRQLIETTNRLTIIHNDLSSPEPEPVQEKDPAPEPAKKPAPTASETPAAPSAVRDAAPPSLDTPEVHQAPSDLSNVGEYLGTVGESLSDLASKIREANPTEALSYRLHRQGVWLHLVNPPPASNGNKTSVPPLPDPVRQQLDTLLQHENWAPLLDEAESRLDKFRFCLDIHRYVVLALKGLGQANNAIETIKAELSALLRRMPGLLDLEFSNGTPFADAQTKDWILAQVLSESSSQPSAFGVEDNTWWDPISAALETEQNETVVSAMQAALQEAPDQIQFIQRALRGAAEIRVIPGLGLLLVHLAHHGIGSMNKGGRPAHCALEASCIRQLLQLRTSKASESAVVVKNPSLLQLAVDLGHRSLADALPYFAP